MATTKVSALTAKTTSSGAEELLINDGGTSKKITLSNAVKAFDLPTVPSGIATDTNKEYNLKLTDSSGTETLTWVEETDNDTTYTATGLVAIDGSNVITTTANNYTHPTHDGDDIDLDTTLLSGAVVVSDIDINVTTDTSGHVTDANGAIATRTLTLSDLGYTGSATANNYVHPNHSGEVTSTADGATVIAGNVVDEANLKVSNAPTNGQFLSAQSAATGGMTWAEVDALPSQTGHSGKYLTTDATNASWATLDTDANSTTKGLYEMANTISSNYSITSGNNALTAGPITINTGISVTIPTGSTWVIA